MNKKIFFGIALLSIIASQSLHSYSSCCQKRKTRATRMKRRREIAKKQQKAKEKEIKEKTSTKS